jgi:hypothetical protein
VAGLRDGADASVANSRREAVRRLQLVVTELMASPACSGMALTRRSAVGSGAPRVGPPAVLAQARGWPLGRAPPRCSPLIGRRASGSLGAHAKDSRRRPSGLRRSRARSGLRLGLDGFRGRARGRAGGLERTGWSAS